MVRASHLFSTALVLVVAVHSASAQHTATPSISLTSIPPGTRVRVAGPALGAAPRIAHVLAPRSDTLLLQPEHSADTLAIPVTGISRLEVSGGRHGHGWAGTGLGILVFGAWGATQSDNSCPSYSVGCRNGNLALAGALFGAGIGAVVGHFWKTEKWQSVLPAAAR